MRRASAPCRRSALPTKPYMEHARALWEELGLPQLNVQIALARLHARRLDRHLGDLCPADDGGRLEEPAARR